MTFNIEVEVTPNGFRATVREGETAVKVFGFVKAEKSVHKLMRDVATELAELKYAAELREENRIRESIRQSEIAARGRVTPPSLLPPPLPQC